MVEDGQATCYLIIQVYEIMINIEIGFAKLDCFCEENPKSKKRRMIVTPSDTKAEN